MAFEYGATPEEIYSMYAHSIGRPEVEGGLNRVRQRLLANPDQSVEYATVWSPKHPKDFEPPIVVGDNKSVDSGWLREKFGNPDMYIDAHSHMYGDANPSTHLDNSHRNQMAGDLREHWRAPYPRAETMQIVSVPDNTSVMRTNRYLDPAIFRQTSRTVSHGLLEDRDWLRSLMNESGADLDEAGIARLIKEHPSVVTEPVLTHAERAGDVTRLSNNPASIEEEYGPGILNEIYHRLVSNRVLRAASPAMGFLPDAIHGAALSRNSPDISVPEALMYEPIVGAAESYRQGDSRPPATEEILRYLKAVPPEA